LPEVLFTPDVAVALDLSEPAARCALRSGKLGPAFAVAGRDAILRTDFLSTLHEAARREVCKEVVDATRK
jgi:hypothetical protein